MCTLGRGGSLKEGGGRCEVGEWETNSEEMTKIFTNDTRFKPSNCPRMTTYMHAHTHTRIYTHKITTHSHKFSPSFLHSHCRSFATPPIPSLLAITCKCFRHTTHPLHFVSCQYRHLPPQLFRMLPTPFARTNLYDTICTAPSPKDTLSNEFPTQFQ